MKKIVSVFSTLAIACALSAPMFAKSPKPAKAQATTTSAATTHKAKTKKMHVKKSAAKKNSQKTAMPSTK